MTPAAHTLYSVTLLLALFALNRWTERRRRVPRTLRTAVQAVTSPDTQQVPAGAVQ